jgi:alkaline phosphatase
LAEYDELRNQAEPVYEDYALARVVSRNYTGIGWTTHGHNAEDVPVWTYGNGEVEGTVDNTDLAHTCAQWLGLNLDTLTQNLYMDADVALPGFWSVTSTDRDNNPQLILGNATIPLDTNIFMVNGSSMKLDSLVVYAPETGKVYLPWDAVWYAILVNGWW